MQIFAVCDSLKNAQRKHIDPHFTVLPQLSQEEFYQHGVFFVVSTILSIILFVQHPLNFLSKREKDAGPRARVLSLFLPAAICPPLVQFMIQPRTRRALFSAMLAVKVSRSGRRRSRSVNRTE